MQAIYLTQSPSGWSFTMSSSTSGFTYSNQNPTEQNNQAFTIQSPSLILSSTPALAISALSASFFINNSTNGTINYTISSSLSNKTYNVYPISQRQYQFSQFTINSSCSGATFSYTATLYDGSALPSFIFFNANNRTFVSYPSLTDVGTYNISVTATLFNGQILVAYFNIIVQNPCDYATLVAPSISGTTYNIGSTS